jgi:hypothetical protein
LLYWLPLTPHSSRLTIQEDRLPPIRISGKILRNSCLIEFFLATSIAGYKTSAAVLLFSHAAVPNKSPTPKLSRKIIAAVLLLRRNISYNCTILSLSFTSKLQHIALPCAFAE